MSGVVMGTAIVAFAALKAGPALFALSGREPDRVFRIAWPLCLWLVAMVLLFALVPDSALLEGRDADPVLMAASTAVTLICALPLLRHGWWLWRRRAQASSAKA